MSPELAHQLTTLDSAVLGARIKAARVAAGLTQPELASTDASVAYLSRIESGQRRPSAELLGALAERLGVTLEYLAYGTEWQDACRLELQLDHAELSLAGGEGLNALNLSREALRSPGLDAVSGGRIRARYIEAAALDVMGDAHAIPALQQLLNDAADVGIRIKAATALCRIWREEGQFERAIACAQSQLSSLSADALGTEEAIRLSVTLAAALFVSGRASEAAEVCDQAIAESERLSSPVARASAYWNASIIRADSGDVAEALPLAKRALHLLENTERVRDVGRLRVQLGWIMLRTNPPRLQDAREQLRLAGLELDWSDASPTDRVRNGLVNAHALLIDGEIEQAREAALDVLAESGETLPLLSVEALMLLGQAAWTTDDREQAHKWYREAIARLTGMGADREAAQVWFEIGTLASEADLIAESADAFRRAAASAGLAATRPVVPQRAVSQRAARSLVPAGRLPVVGTPPAGSPRTTPGQSPNGRV